MDDTGGLNGVEWGPYKAMADAGESCFGLDGPGAVVRLKGDGGGGVPFGQVVLPVCTE